MPLRPYNRATSGTGLNFPLWHNLQGPGKMLVRPQSDADVFAVSKCSPYHIFPNQLMPTPERCMCAIGVAIVFCLLWRIWSCYIEMTEGSFCHGSVWSMLVKKKPPFGGACSRKIPTSTWETQPTKIWTRKIGGWTEFFLGGGGGGAQHVDQMFS